MIAPFASQLIDVQLLGGLIVIASFASRGQLQARVVELAGLSWNGNQGGAFPETGVAASRGVATNCETF